MPEADRPEGSEGATRGGSKRPPPFAGGSGSVTRLRGARVGYGSGWARARGGSGSSRRVLSGSRGDPTVGHKYLGGIGGTLTTEAIPDGPLGVRVVLHNCGAGGRVDHWRQGGSAGLSVAAPFGRRCLTRVRRDVVDSVD